MSRWVATSGNTVSYRTPAMAARCSTNRMRYPTSFTRSEERRVGKECSSRVWPYHSSRRRHTRWTGDWSSDVCSSDLVPANIDLFDRGISQGDVPRLWIDVIAHVEMGRDKRQYRFLQDTRYGRAVLDESYEIPDIVHEIGRASCRERV